MLYRIFVLAFTKRVSILRQFGERIMVRNALSKWTVLAFVLGTLFGSGSIWQWKQTQIEGQKAELDRIVRTTELRRQQNDLYLKFINVSRQIVQNASGYSKNLDSDARNKNGDLNAQLELTKDDLLTLEKAIATLEGRQPRSIRLDFIPP